MLLARPREEGTSPVLPSSGGIEPRPYRSPEESLPIPGKRGILPGLAYLILSWELEEGSSPKRKGRAPQGSTWYRERGFVLKERLPRKGEMSLL